MNVNNENAGETENKEMKLGIESMQIGKNGGQGVYRMRKK